jgi:serine protease AprX
MRGRGGLPQFITTALAVVLVTSSLGTAWTVRSSFSSHVDPSLRAGEVALVHTTAGRAGALSMNLTKLGAVDVQTESAADTVIARLSGDALAAIAHDPSVTVATRDIPVVALDGANGRSGWEETTGRLGDGLKTSASFAAIRAPRAQSRAKGENVTVAIMDTGIATSSDLPREKLRGQMNFVADNNSLQDAGGHGTFIAGVIAADGELKGVAPDASLVSLRVLDANGNGTAAGVVRAFNWLLQHRAVFDIKVLNISWGAPQATSYHEDLLAALVESAWFSGITVVVAAGNGGPTPGSVLSPGSDPFVVTVGAFNDKGTMDTSDDVASTFSGVGPTRDGFTKPETLAPGDHILGLRVKGVSYLDASGKPIGSPSDRYVHMTGTSAAAGFVSGVAALIASAHPTYSPTQIKGAIVASGRSVAGSATKAVDAVNALTAMTTVNAGLVPSHVLLTLLAQAHLLKVNGVTWDGVTWDSVTWETVTWETVTWEAVTWESVSWETVSWERLLQ